MKPFVPGDIRLRLHLPDGLVILAGADPGTANGVYPAPLGERLAILPMRARGSTGFSPDPAVRARIEAHLNRSGRSWFPAAIGDFDWTCVVEAVAMPDLTRDEADVCCEELGLDDVLFWDSTTLVRSSGSAGPRELMGWVLLAPDRDALAVDQGYRRLGVRSPYVNLAELRHALEAALADIGDSSDEVRALDYAQLDLAQEHWRISDRQRRLVLEARKEDAAREQRDQAAVNSKKRRAAAARKAAKQAAEAQAMKVKHADDVAAGWPAKWAPQEVAAFTQLGGTAAQAADFTASGWPAHEVIQVAESIGEARAMRPPPEPRKHHASLGHGLKDVAGVVWPSTPGETLLFLRRSGGGRREQWAIVSVDTGVEVHGWRLRQGAWVPVASGHAASLEAVVKETSALRRVPVGMASSYVLSETDTDSFVEWLQLPTVAAASEASITDRDLALVNVESGWVEDSLHGLNHQVLCWVDEQILTRVEVGGRWRTLMVDPNEEALPGHEIGRFTWSSESGGAPISWDGGNSLTVVAPGLIDERTWGDLERPRQLVAAPLTDAALARVIADWLTRLEVPVAAALELEGWPDAAIVDKDGVEYELPTFGLSLDIGDEVVEAVRRRLARVDSTYRGTRHAIRHPRSADGRSLVGAIREAARSGVIGELMRGS